MWWGETMIKIIPDHEGWLTQWDKNRTVLVSGLDLTEYPDAVIQFSSPNDGVDKAYPVKPYVGDDGLVHAEFPNIFLTFPGRVDVCVYRDDHTCSFGVLVVVPHEKPDDYVYTETEVLRFESKEDLANKVDEITEENTDDVYYPTTGAITKYGALRYTTAQELTEAQKAIARQNIDVLGSYEIVMTYDESTKRYSLNANYRTVYEDIFKKGRIPYITYYDTTKGERAQKIYFYFSGISNEYVYLGFKTAMVFQSSSGDSPYDNVNRFISRTVVWDYGASSNTQVQFYENEFEATAVVAELGEKTQANLFYNYQNYLSGMNYGDIVANQSKYALARLGYYSNKKLFAPILSLESIDDNEIIYSAMTIDESGIIRRRGIRVPSSGGAKYYESLIDEEYDFQSDLNEQNPNSPSFVRNNPFVLATSFGFVSEPEEGEDESLYPRLYVSSSVPLDILAGAFNYQPGPILFVDTSPFLWKGNVTATGSGGSTNTSGTGSDIRVPYGYVANRCTDTDDALIKVYLFDDNSGSSSGTGTSTST